MGWGLLRFIVNLQNIDLLPIDNIRTDFQPRFQILILEFLKVIKRYVRDTRVGGGVDIASYIYINGGRGQRPIERPSYIVKRKEAFILSKKKVHSLFCAG